MLAQRWQDARPRTRDEGRRLRRKLRNRSIATALGVAACFGVGHFYSPNRPTTYAASSDHFKYGSIGSDMENGLPLRVLRVLPDTFPENLPPGASKNWTAFGFIQEPGHEMPIGFSKRRRFIDLTGLNCAACHTGVVRESESSPATIYMGMPANTVDVLSFFNFLFVCAADEQFVEKVMSAIEADGGLLFFERPLYRWAVELTQKGLIERRDQLAKYMPPGHPRWGPGRVDTFNPYKVNQFAAYYDTNPDPDVVEPFIPEEERYGTVDFPSVWNQRRRENLQLHWDGGNTSVFERNISAALGAGATRESVDLPKIERLREWLYDWPAPRYPFPQTASAETLRQGERVYLQYCFRCHDFSGADVGTVVPLKDIDTDPNRWATYTPKVVAIQHDYGQGYGWEWIHFAKTDGYSNHPLDGIWARAPYLHNGSVPTMWALLQDEESRPPKFYTGHGVYDQKNLGFAADVRSVGGRESFPYDTTKRGNDNKGHSGPAFGTQLDDEAKWALIEFLKTL